MPGSTSRSRRAVSAPLPAFLRPIYLFGEVHDPRDRYIEKTHQNFMAAIKDHPGVRPVAFLEYGHTMDPFFRRVADCVYEDKVLACLGLLYSFSFLACDILENMEASIHLRFAIVGMAMELKDHYVDVMGEEFLQNLTLIPAVIESDELPKEQKVSIVHHFLSVLSRLIQKMLMDICSKEKSLDPYVADYLTRLDDRLKGIDTLKHPLTTDNNLVYLRDHFLFLQMKKMEHKKDLKVPFLINVGRAHVPNWQRFLRDYQKVYVKRMYRRTERVPEEVPVLESRLYTF